MNVLDAKIQEGQLVKETTGTATTVAAAVATFDPECTAFILKNLSATVKLLYSIDAGSNYLTLEPLSTIEKNRFARSLLVKTTASTAAYNVEYTESQ